jgi:hypothetical protein
MKRIAILAGGLLAAHAVSAGVYVETVSHDIKAGTTQLAQKMYVQGGDGRFVDDGGRVTLIKGDSMYIIDDSDKSYVLFDKATMEQLAKKLASAMEQMKEQMAKLPPEQRAQMEQAMAGAGMVEGKKYTVDVADTGQSDSVEGRSCRLWNVTRNGELDEQICVVPYSTLPGKEDFRAVFAKFARVFEEMTKSVPMLSGMMSNEFGAHVKANGYPVRSRAYDHGKLGDDETLVKVWREETMPGSMFEVPAGYHQKQMPMGPGQ